MANLNNILESLEKASAEEWMLDRMYPDGNFAKGPTPNLSDILISKTKDFQFDPIGALQKEYANVKAGKPEQTMQGVRNPNTNLQKFLSDTVRDVARITTNPNKPDGNIVVSAIKTMIKEAGLKKTAEELQDLGVRINPDKVKDISDILTRENIVQLGEQITLPTDKDQENLELGILAGDKQNKLGNLREYLDEKGKLPSYLEVARSSYMPKSIKDGKAIYDPITPENQNKFFDQKEIDTLGSMLREKDAPNFMDPREGILDTKDAKYPDALKEAEQNAELDKIDNPNLGGGLYNYLSGVSKDGRNVGDPVTGLGDTLGSATYGSYDPQTGEWNPGVPDKDGAYTVRDTYNWNRDQRSGIAAIYDALNNPTSVASDYGAEGVLQTTGPDKTEGIDIEINVPTYTQQQAQQVMTDRFGAGYGLGYYMPTQEEIYTAMEQDNGSSEDSGDDYSDQGYSDSPDDSVFGMKGGGHIFREVNKLKMNDRNAKNNLYEMIGIKPVVEKQYGGGLSDAYSTLADRRQNMYGMGQTPSQMSSVFQDPMEASAFSPVNMEQGGDIVVPKERMINDQPHELSYINPQEAKLLKDLGGSGRKVDGIPAYYYGSGDDSADEMDPNFSDFGDDQGSYQDQLEQAMSRQSPSLASLVDQGIISKDEAYTSDQFGPSIALAAAQARAQDIKDSKQDMGDSIRYLGRPNRSEIRNIQKDDVLKLQDLIDADQLVGAGIPVANMLEKDYGLRTFNKGLRSGLEQYSQGSATNRDDPNLGGFVDDSEVVKDFLMELERAKPGETMSQFAERYSKETGREAPLGRIGFDPSSSRDMSKNAADVNAAIQENNLKGAIQGLGLFGGMFTGAGGLGNFTQGYTGEFKGTTPQSQTAFGAAALGLSKGLGLDTLVDKFGNIISTGREAIFGPKESEFKQREAIAREQLGREPTLEEVNNVNLSSSSISPSDVLGFVDNPFSALVALGSGKPTTAADIARAREEAEKDKSIKPTNTFDSELATTTGAIVPTEKNITSLNNNLIFDSGNDQVKRKRIVKPDTPKEVIEAVEEKEEVTTDGKLSNRAKASAESIKSLIKLRNASSDAQIDAIISDLGIDKAGLTVSEFLKELGIER